MYGPHLDDKKLLFLQELRLVRSMCQGPWVIGGDFNLISRAEDKNNGNLDRAMKGRFRRLINELQLMELLMLGRRFTWSNEWSSPTLVRLDRVLYTSEWEDIFLDCLLQTTASLISDHCPLVLGLHDLTQGKDVSILRVFGRGLMAPWMRWQVHGLSRMKLHALSNVLQIS